MAYQLELTEGDRSAINFVGGRYEWSDALRRLVPEGDEGETVYQVPEHIAWELRDAFEADTEGGHSFFPMLDQRSTLAEKLYAFMDAIV